MTRAPRQSHRARPVFALFRVAAGPRLGHGHLRRAEALAAALARPACVSVRGAAPDTPLRQTTGHAADAVLAAEAPAVLVLDDPHAGHGERWCRAADRRAIPVVSLHDLGIGRVASTLAIDGSITSPRRGWPSRDLLRGLDYAVIRPPRRAPGRTAVHRVLISLGGTPRPTLVDAIVSALTHQWPDLDVIVPTRAASPASRPRMRSVAAHDGLAPWFARVDAAIVGGGVSLYEAVAAGVPTVALAIVAAQRPTIRGFAARRLALDGGAVGDDTAATANRVVRAFARLLRDDAWRTAIRAEGPVVVDGFGAQRVARAIAALADANARA
jgi:spore coat polysaccharide biosynthesis predicted glycosyltransferase SpsG